MMGRRRMEVGKRYRIGGMLVECLPGRNRGGGQIVRRVSDFEQASAVGAAAALLKRKRAAAEKAEAGEGTRKA